MASPKPRPTKYSMTWPAEAVKGKYGFKGSKRARGRIDFGDSPQSKIGTDTGQVGCTLVFGVFSCRHCLFSSYYAYYKAY